MTMYAMYRLAVLFLGSVSCLKVETNLSMKLSEVNLPTCQGTMLPKVVDSDHWQCDTLSGLKGAEAEKKCRESYDTNEEGKPHLQCAVSYRSETAFNCLSTTPCQAPKDPLEAWNHLKKLAADVPVKRIFIKLSDTRLIHVKNQKGVAALSDTKVVACGSKGGSTGYAQFCQVIELKDGALQTGNKLRVDDWSYQWVERAGQDKVMYCVKKSSKVTCSPLTADGLTLTRGPEVVVPMRLSTISMTFEETLLQLGENRLLLCYNERIEWAKNHALACRILEEKDGKWTLGPEKVIAEKMTHAYVRAHTSLLSPGKVFMCYHPDSSNMIHKCGVVEVSGTSITWVGNTYEVQNTGIAFQTTLSSERAVFCDPKKQKCYLLGINGNTVSQVSEFTIPIKEDRRSTMARLWNDRLIYCAERSGGHGPYASPLCYPITCVDDTCAFGGAMSVNGEEGKRPPLTASTVATTVGPGKVMVCADDRGTDFNAFGTRGTQHPVCALFYLDGQL